MLVAFKAKTNEMCPISDNTGVNDLKCNCIIVFISKTNIKLNIK